MSEMRRLKEETRSPFTRSLLASVEADRADSGACDRALGALGLGAAGVAASTAAKAAGLGGTGAKGAGAVSIAPAAAKGGALLLVKWIGIGVIGGAVAIGSAQYARHVIASSSRPLRASAPVRSDPRAASASPIPAPDEQLDPQVSASAIVLTTTPTSSRNAASFPSRARKVSPNGAREDDTSPRLTMPLLADAPSAPLVSPHLPAADSVSTQLESLSAIRAVGFAAPQRVLVLLDEFERRFPSSPLREEVAVLRIDALVDAGRRAEGATLASDFLAAHPASAYAQRVRSKVKSP